MLIDLQLVVSRNSQSRSEKFFAGMSADSNAQDDQCKQIGECEAGAMILILLVLRDATQRHVIAWLVLTPGDLWMPSSGIRTVFAMDQGISIGKTLRMPLDGIHRVAGVNTRRPMERH